MTTETALAPIEVTNDQLELIKRTVAVGATNDELRLFMHDCQRQGVHPLDKLLHFTKRKGKYTPITSIDLMRTRAADTGEMAGSDEPVFGTDDYDNWASVTVYRLTQGQRFPYTAKAFLSEYIPEGANERFMWDKMPRTMLAKCAEALALRKAFPKQLFGVYVKEELDQAMQDGRGDTAAGTTRGDSAAQDGERGGKSDRPVDAATGSSPQADRGPAVLSERQHATVPAADEDEQGRNTLIAEGSTLLKGLPLAVKRAMLKQYCGDENADVFTADRSALSDLVKGLRTRQQARDKQGLA